MIIGTGVDIVDVKRFIGWNKEKCSRFFHQDEIAQLVEKKGLQFPLSLVGAESFSARFAAKEAFGKALGTGLAGLKLKDIAVFTDEKGKPFMKLYNKAAMAFVEIKGGVIHLTLSHEKTNAIAFVLIEV